MSSVNDRQNALSLFQYVSRVVMMAVLAGLMALIANSPADAAAKGKERAFRQNGVSCFGTAAACKRRFGFLAPANRLRPATRARRLLGAAPQGVGRATFAEGECQQILQPGRLARNLCADVADGVKDRPFRVERSDQQAASSNNSSGNNVGNNSRSLSDNGG